MQKKVIVFLLLSLSSIISNAQSLIFLKDQNRINVVINYDETLIHGVPSSDFEEIEEDWLKDQPILFVKFISEFNKAVKSIFVGGKIKQAAYTIEVYPVSIDDHGNTIAYYVVKDCDGNEVFHSSNLKAKGGRFGSKLNLIGDGLESLGKRIGYDIKKNIK